MKKIFFIVFGLFAVNLAFGQTNFFVQLADSAFTLTKQQVQYDPAYRQIGYPNGDVPPNKAVFLMLILCNKAMIFNDKR